MKQTTPFSDHSRTPTTMRRGLAEPERHGSLGPHGNASLRLRGCAAEGTLTPTCTSTCCFNASKRSCVSHALLLNIRRRPLAQVFGVARQHECLNKMSPQSQFCFLGFFNFDFFYQGFVFICFFGELWIVWTLFVLFGFLDFWTLGFLGVWICGLLDFWIVGFLDFLIC